jgi:hypothetical protein
MIFINIPPPLNRVLEFKNEQFTIFIIKGSVIERIPPFSFDKIREKIDDFINISSELIELIKQPLFSQII